MKPKIIIVMEGGIIQNMLSDVPMDAVIIDYDVEGMDGDDLTEICIYPNIPYAYCRLEEPELLPKETKTLYKLVKKDLKAKDND
jgi:hypothetical protein